MTENVNYEAAPIGTVAADEYTTLVKNDKGWYWLEGRLQEGDDHRLPRKVVHEFKLGEVITPETLAWLPPDSVITPEREDHAMVRNDNGGWGWADGIPGGKPTTLVARWVAPDKYTLTKFPGLEENPYVVGKTLEGEAAYEGAPAGTVVELFTMGEPIKRFKTKNGDWRRLDNPTLSAEGGSMVTSREIIDFLTPWEVDLLTTPPKADPREEGSKFIKYTYNPEKGTVYTHPHRDFGRVVELPNGRFLAVPNRAPREFETAQEAVEWLI